MLSKKQLQDQSSIVSQGRPKIDPGGRPFINQVPTLKGNQRKPCSGPPDFGTSPPPKATPSARQQRAQRQPIHEHRQQGLSAASGRSGPDSWVPPLDLVFEGNSKKQKRFQVGENHPWVCLFLSVPFLGGFKGKPQGTSAFAGSLF